MAYICTAEDFIVEAVYRPLGTRTDRGHIAIFPKIRVKNRTRLSPRLAIELMWLTMLSEEAMSVEMDNREIDVGNINYEDNGNWGVFLLEGTFLHVYLYRRVKYQPSA
ncbi:MAG: hypothetical protein WCX28_08750 [Bacteriovoracaceae bacterium]|nr:hypothetical protein [Bacteroidota bacterium]